MTMDEHVDEYVDEYRTIDEYRALFCESLIEAGVARNQAREIADKPPVRLAIDYFSITREVSA